FAVSRLLLNRLPRPSVLARPEGMASLRYWVWEPSNWPRPLAFNPCDAACLPMSPIMNGAAMPINEVAEPLRMPQWLAIKSVTAPSLEPNNEPSSDWLLDCSPPLLNLLTRPP